jgi:dUTP pyrophosphatase
MAKKDVGMTTVIESKNFKAKEEPSMTEIVIESLVVKMKCFSESARLERQSQGSSGFDIFAVQDIRLGPGRYGMVPTGIGLEIPKGFEAQIRPRSGLAAKQGITVLNSPGTIDSDYRGEINVILINHSEYPFMLRAGDRVAQLVFQKVVSDVCFDKVEALSDTDRGSGGFGSTGNR